MRVPEGPQYKGFILVGEREGDPDNSYQEELERRKDERPGFRSNPIPYVDAEKTNQTVTTFNISTKQYSDKSIYIGKKGEYIKTYGRKLYLKEFK